MKYVYILESLDSEHFYVGITDDLRARLAKHNAGEVPHTSKYGPWRIKTYVAFSDEKQAVAFEKYLKSRSGRAFAKKRPLDRSPYSPITAFNRSRSATISSFIATSSADRTGRRRQDRLRHGARLFLQRLALRRQRDQHLTFVFACARALDEVRRPPAA